MFFGHDVSPYLLSIILVFPQALAYTPTPAGHPRFLLKTRLSRVNFELDCGGFERYAQDSFVAPIKPKVDSHDPARQGGFRVFTEDIVRGILDFYNRLLRFPRFCRFLDWTELELLCRFANCDPLPNFLTETARRQWLSAVGRSPNFGLAAVELASPIGHPSSKHDSRKPQETVNPSPARTVARTKRRKK